MISAAHRRCVFYRVPGQWHEAPPGLPVEDAGSPGLLRLEAARPLMSRVYLHAARDAPATNLFLSFHR